MLFSSIVFIYLFLPAVVLVYFVLLRNHRSAQNCFLFIASLFFYAWGEPKFVLILILSIVINWLIGLCMDSRANTVFRKILFVCSIVFDLGILFVFKYLTFTGRVANRFLGTAFNIPSIVLPIGVSFFTFQALSYVIDVFRGDQKAQKNPLNVGLYIAFFPQLIAGPIVRYGDIAKQIQNRKETPDDVFDGFARFVAGLAKKVLLANTLAVFADKAFSLGSSGNALSCGFAWLGLSGYVLQLYFDFSGYSDMAIGLGRMFGFHFQENFNYPFMSDSISEFWRRWHISLGSWFRDYVYIPMGGNRRSRFRNVFNLFVVWALTGFWHGANYTFILWGLYFFALILFERAVGLNKPSAGRVPVLRRIYSVFFFILSFSLFRSDSVGAAVNYLKCLFHFNGNHVIDGIFTGYFKQNIIIIIVGILVCTPLPKKIINRMKHRNASDFIRVLCLMGLFLLSTASIVSGSYNPFIYFNF
ncbi:MAG: MBOAT family protein [Lachnospiraceae bacterium]|nr:MBOAT family protein [Lachnospiraceae bacterium]